jgi:hypothetical protein
MAQNHQGRCAAAIRESGAAFGFNTLRVAGNLQNRGRDRELRTRQLEEKMKTKLFTLLLLAGSASALVAGPRVFARFGVGYGGYGYAAPAPMYYAPMPAPRVVRYVPPCPGPGYAWVDGYWVPSGPSYAWHAGYWARPAHAGARWVAPRYYGHSYYGGYWRR